MNLIISFIIGALVSALVTFSYFEKRYEKLDGECAKAYNKASALIMRQQETIKRQAHELAYYKLGDDAKNDSAERAVGSNEAGSNQDATEQTS